MPRAPRGAGGTGRIARFGAMLSGKSGSGFFQGFLSGAALGMVWTPCVGPILAGVITLIISGGINAEVVFWKEGTASALDSRTISLVRDTGSANAFFAEADGRVLDFRRSGSGFSDLQTGSKWDLTGSAVEGALKGSRLVPAEAVQHFRFSYNVFSGK